MEELRTEPELISIDDLVEAMNVAGPASEELLTKTFKREDVEGAPAEISRKMIQRVVETAQLDLTDTDRFKLYGVVLTRALAMQADSELENWPFWLNLGKEGQEKDMCPKTIWVRRPGMRKVRSKEWDSRRKSLLSSGTLLAMLQGNEFNDKSSNPRRLKTLKDLDDFFGYLPTGEEGKIPNTRGISSQDLVATAHEGVETRKWLDDLREIFPVEFVETRKSCSWAVRFYSDYRAGRPGEKCRFVGCASLGNLLTFLEEAKNSAADDAEREKLKQTIDLLNKLRNFVNEHAKDKIAMF